MPIDIDHLGIEELEALNERIVARLKFLDKVRAHHDMMAFNIGNRVSFDSPQHGRQVGTLVKFNLKTVTVVTENGRRWNRKFDTLCRIRAEFRAWAIVKTGT